MESLARVLLCLVRVGVPQVSWAVRYLDKLLWRAIKGECWYMTVRINWSDQLNGSNWIRKANPEKPTVGHVLSTVGRGLSAKGCQQLTGQGLWRKIYGFSLDEGVQGRLFYMVNFDGNLMMDSMGWPYDSSDCLLL